MTLWQTLGQAALVILVYMIGWFAVALLVRRNDVVDVAWGLGFITIAAWHLISAEGPSLRQYVMSALVTIWGARLAWHIARRNLRPGKTEDKRYAAWRRAWGKWLVPRSFLQIFMLQGLFMLLVSMPLHVAAAARGPAFGVLDALGVVVWVSGFVFEAMGDRQLKTFLADPKNRGHVMDRGLWAYTRHPNYFGEATMWWGIGILALSVSQGWVALLGPLVITWLLTSVSGVPLLEKEHRGEPEWDAYRARTSVFVPLPPVRG